MNYLIDIKPLEDAELNDTQIAASLGALYVRNFPITASGDQQPDSIHGLLTSEFGVMSMGNAQEWRGPLIDLRATNPQVDAAMGVLISFLQVQGATLRCSTEASQGGLLTLIAEAVANIIQAQHDADASLQPKTYATVWERVHEITGGLKFPGIDAAAVSAARQAHLDAEAETARRSTIAALEARILNDFINPAIADGSSTDSDVITAIKAGL